MTGGAITLSVFAYIFVLYKFNGSFLTQQVLFLFIYLVSLSAASVMDIVLPIYFIFSLMPFIGKIKRISKMTYFLSLYFGINLFFGLMFQNTTASIITFVAKLWQFLVFFIAFDLDVDILDDSEYWQILLSVIIESILGIYLMITSNNMDANGMVRLVSGAQPITGNIAVAILPMLVYLYFKNRNNSRFEFRLFVISIILFIWIVLSGTRGYTLMFVFTMAIVFYDYLFNQKNRIITSNRNRLVLSFLFVSIVLCVVFFVPQVTEKISSVLRIKSSIGIRTYENKAEMDFFEKSPLHIQLFGIGVGGTAGQNLIFRAAINKQASLGMWNLKHYLYDSGALFHNFFANILLNLGIIGMIFILLANIGIWRRISFVCGEDKALKIIFHLYQISFLLMNYYRWSGDCGISEMIILGLILRFILNEQNNKESLAYNTDENDY